MGVWKQSHEIYCLLIWVFHSLFCHGWSFNTSRKWPEYYGLQNDEKHSSKYPTLSPLHNERSKSISLQTHLQQSSLQTHRRSKSKSWNIRICFIYWSKRIWISFMSIQPNFLLALKEVNFYYKTVINIHTQQGLRKLLKSGGHKPDFVRNLSIIN